MKLFMLAGSMIVGLFASNSEVQDAAQNMWENRGREPQQQVFLTEEEGILREYIRELLEEYSEEGLTQEEIEEARQELLTLVELKAEELGVTLNPELDLLDRLDHLLERRETHELFVELREYYQELVSMYDFDMMTEEEIQEAREFIREQLILKAEELGIDISDYQNRGSYGQCGPGRGRRGRGYRTDSSRDYFDTASDNPLETSGI